MEPQFELLPLLDAAMSGIRAINRACVEIDLDRALASVPILAAALDHLDRVEGEPMLFWFQRGSEGTEVIPRPLHASSVRQLQMVYEGRARRESLWKISEPVPPPLPLDPAVVRGQFHRHNRGVQLISAWLQEGGGGTARFVDLVNRLISEDQSIEPVLTGLINTTALLAYMTAGALGTNVEALISGILDLYSQIDTEA
jgi:hypothetical protein